MIIVVVVVSYALHVLNGKQQAETLAFKIHYSIRWHYPCIPPYRLLMIEVYGTLGIFEGSAGELFFAYDQRALEEQKFFKAGKMTAWSVAHNGPGPRSLNKNVFRMMCGQKPQLSSMDISSLLEDDQKSKMEQVFIWCNVWSNL